MGPLDLKKRLIGNFLLMGVLAWTWPVRAQADQGDAPGSSRPKSSFIDITHETWSNRILRLANNVDSFFGDERMDDEVNDSRVRLYTLYRFWESEQPYAEIGYRIQFELPRTEKRLQLVFRNDDENEPQSSVAALDQAAESAQESPYQSATAGLRYLMDLANVKASVDTGIKVAWPPLLYGRFRVSRNFQLGKWAFRPIEKLYWMDTRGWSSQTDLHFDYRVNPSLLFRFANTLRWDEEDDITRFTSGPSWFQSLDDRSAISYSAISSWDNENEWKVTSYSVGAGYRQLLYKEWFFWEVRPALVFPRSKNFRRSPGITFQFEAIFGSV